MPNTINFITHASTKRLRKEIQNICDSYSHPWDVLAELCQNSVDAIIKYNRLYGETAHKQHSITISLDSKVRSISVRDTGHGFPKDKFPELLGPHGTDKEDSPDLIGEKGVGLTYTIFTSNYYSMKSRSTEVAIEGNIVNAARWRDGKVPDMPMFNTTNWEEGKFSPQDTFAEITLQDIDQLYPEESDLFAQSTNVLEFILRTKTAIGHTKALFGGPGLNVAVKLVFTDPTGKRFDLDLSPTYMVPTQFLHASDVVELDAFKAKAGLLDDQQKAKQLGGKCLVKTSSIIRAGKRIDYHAFFAPSRALWTEFSEKNRIYSVDPDGTHKPLYHSGIWIASRGMPSGISLEPPQTGQMGYWPAFFMILEDDSIRFDLGRKYVPGRTQGLLRELARQIFNEFIPYVKYVTKDPEVVATTNSTIQQYERAKYFETLKSLPDLAIPKLNYQKHPDHQEAGVVALFHELLGAGILKGYYGYRTGFMQTYDLWAQYKIDKSLVAAKYANIANKAGIIDMPIVVEFKYMAESILEDSHEDKKFFTDIDLIVCWDLDELKFSKQSVSVESLPKTDALFFGSNFRLEWPAAYNLGSAAQKPVLSLRKFLQDNSTA